MSFVCSSADSSHQLRLSHSFQTRGKWHRRILAPQVKGREPLCFFRIGMGEMLLLLLVMSWRWTRLPTVTTAAHCSHHTSFSCLWNGNNNFDNLFLDKLKKAYLTIQGHHHHHHCFGKVVFSTYLRLFSNFVCPEMQRKYYIMFLILWAWTHGKIRVGL